MVDNRNQGGSIKIPFVGLWIDRRLDFLALAAFILALLSIIGQIFLFLQGAKVHLDTPSHVLINFSPIRGEMGSFMRISAPMNYANLASAEYGAVLRRETVSVNVDGLSRTLVGHADVTFKDENSDGRLEEKYIDEARPASIIGGGVLSREIYFAPDIIKCDQETTCDENLNFVKRSKAIAWILEQKSIEFQFSCYLFGDIECKPKRCSIDINHRVRHDLSNYGWASTRCWPIE